jgi:hypothetical protein
MFTKHQINGRARDIMKESWKFIEVINPNKELILGYRNRYNEKRKQRETEDFFDDACDTESKAKTFIITSYLEAGVIIEVEINQHRKQREIWNLP